MQSHPFFHGQWKLQKGSPQLKGIPPQQLCAESPENNPSDHAGAASPDVTCDNTTTSTGETDTIVALLERIALLEQKVCYYEEKLAKVENENAGWLDRQFSIETIKADDAAILFYTGFPNYEALVSFYTYIEPNLHKMQYWKGDKQVKESQPYQDDKNWKKPGQN